jgi:ERCC4-type nuclease
MLQASRRRQTPVAEIPGVGEKTAERLAEAGLATLGDLLDKSAEQLAEIPGLGEKTAEKILEAARALEQMPSEEESSEEEGGEGADAGSDDAVVSETPEETTVTD